MNQILNHMGHTWEVHKTYYRHYDSNDLEFLDDPSHAEEDGIPAAVYDKQSDEEEEEDGVFKFGPPGIVFQSVYTMSLYGHFI